MKRILTKLRRNQRGVVLIIVLILLAVGGLTIAPMLSHMSTGLKAGQTYEKKTEEYYAADAGVEDALWQITRIQHDPALPSNEADDDWQYSITDINGKIVDITIDYVDEDADGNDVYKINSVASADGSDTAIESYLIYGGGFGFILDNAITSPSDIDIGSGTVINGNVNFEGTLTNNGVINGNVETETGTIEGNGDLNGDIVLEPIADWPSPDEVAGYYDDDLTGLESYESDTWDIAVDGTTLGPLYRDGTLAIVNTGSAGATLTLNDPYGTIYVTGDTVIGGPHDFTLNLNNQTIFCESPTSGSHNALELTPQCNITGAGCIIAVGDIQFWPNLSGDSFVLVMSINGEVQFQPSGDFVGCLAGDIQVDLNPGQSLDWVDPSALGLNFPNTVTGAGAGRDAVIRTWETS